MTSPITPADAFEKALSEWIQNPDSPKLTTRNCARFGYQYALTSEPVTAVIDLAWDLLEQCNSVNWSDISEAQTVMRNLENQLMAYEAAKGGG